MIAAALSGLALVSFLFGVPALIVALFTNLGRLHRARMAVVTARFAPHVPESHPWAGPSRLDRLDRRNPPVFDRERDARVRDVLERGGRR